MPSLFISHSDKDNSIAQEVAARVKAQGFDYFLDDDILPGEKWEERIHNAMRECIAVLFCATPDALQSRYVFAEIVMTRFRGIPLIPLIFAECDLPSFITGTTEYDDFLSDREVGYRKLFAALELLKLKVASEWRHDESPYPGLLAMEEKYAPVFFGRDAEIQTAIEALRPSAQQKRFLAIIGPSGSGKSSLARAGIIPALKRGAIPGSQNWVYIPPFSPGETPFRNLAEKLRAANPALGGTREIETRLREDKGLLYALLDVRHDDTQVVLLIDQLEEIERRTPRDEATACLARIRETLDAPDTPLIALATLRADFVSACLQYPDLARLFQSGTQLLGVMDRAGLRQAIVGPARVAGLHFDDGLVEEILDDTTGGDALPLMAYVLEELWKQRADSTMAHVVYRKVGGVEGALAQRAQAIYDGMLEAEREPLRCAFIELADVNERGDFTRRRVLLNSLPTETRPALERFVQARLLTTDSDERGAQIDVVHEALLRNWKVLREWLEAEKEQMRVRRELELAAADWDAHGRIDAYLWSGDRAQNALNAIAHESWSQDNLLRVFLEICRTRDHARLERESEQLANRAIKDLNQDSERSILLSLAAIQEYKWTPRAEYALKMSISESRANTRRLVGFGVRTASFSPDGKRIVFACLQGRILVWDNEFDHISWDEHLDFDPLTAAVFSPDGTRIAIASENKKAYILNFPKNNEPVCLQGHTSGVTGVCFSPNGMLVATSSWDKTGRIWETVSGREVVCLEGHQQKVNSANFSFDSNFIVTASSDNTARIWDVIKHKVVRYLAGHAQDVNCAFFSTDGTRIITASLDKTVRIWDATNGKELGRLIGHSSDVRSATFSPNGAYIVTASYDKTARIWDASSGNEVCRLEHEGPVRDASFSHDGMYVVTASRDDYVRIWKYLKRQELTTLAHIRVTRELTKDERREYGLPPKKRDSSRRSE